MSKVICIDHNSCEFSDECGGSKPHRYDDEECGKCPRNKSATCIPYVGIDTADNKPCPIVQAIMAMTGGYYDEDGDIRCSTCGYKNEICQCQEAV